MEGEVQIVERDRWAREQFGEAGLGEVRRTRRLVKLGARMAGHGSGTIPRHTRRSADMKAAYRVFAQEAVTHEGAVDLAVC